MPIKHGGMLASRASTWLRDHFWRKTIAPRSSRPTMWNEYLPISIPITAIADLRLSDMACSCLSRPLPASNAGEAGARPDHPISRLLGESSGTPGPVLSTVELARCRVCHDQTRPREKAARPSLWSLGIKERGDHAVRDSRYEVLNAEFTVC